MFERFTDRARRVLVIAQEEARALGHNVLGSEHMLLALLEEGEGVAAKVLGELGLDAGQLRQRVKDAGGLGVSGEATVSPPFTPGAKRSLERSLREALQLGHNYIGTEHLLLGLLGEPQDPGPVLLVECGLPLEQVRIQVLKLLSGYAPSSPEPAPSPGGGQGPYEVGLGLGMSLRIDDPDLAREVRELVAVTDPLPLGLAVRQMIEEHLRQRRQREDQPPPPTD